MTGLLCLALVWGTTAPIRVALPDDDETTSIGLRAPEVPLAALEATSSVRFEKTGQAIRLTFHKPERIAHLSSIDRSCGLLFRPKGRSTTSLLPRRFLPPRHVTPRAPDDAADPFLAWLA